MTEPGHRTGRRGRRAATAPARKVSYHPIFNRLPHPEVFSADQVASIHDTALRVLEELGIRVLHDEGRWRFREAGARVDEDSQMVHIDRGLVAEALVEPELTEPGTKLSTHIVGVERAARVLAPSPYDPSGARMRG